MFNRFCLKLVMWLLWANYRRSLRMVLGHSNVAQARHEEFYLDARIRKENRLPPIIDGLTWDNTGKTDRAVFARWVTLKSFANGGK